MRPNFSKLHPKPEVASQNPRVASQIPGVASQNFQRCVFIVRVINATWSRPAAVIETLSILVHRRPGLRSNFRSGLFIMRITMPPAAELQQLSKLHQFLCVGGLCRVPMDPYIHSRYLFHFSLLFFPTDHFPSVVLFKGSILVYPFQEWIWRSSTHCLLKTKGKF